MQYTQDTKFKAYYHFMVLLYSSEEESPNYCKASTSHYVIKVMAGKRYQVSYKSHKKLKT